VSVLISISSLSGAGWPTKVTLPCSVCMTNEPTRARTLMSTRAVVSPKDFVVFQKSISGLGAFGFGLKKECIVDIAECAGRDCLLGDSVDLVDTVMCKSKHWQLTEVTDDR